MSVGGKGEVSDCGIIGSEDIRVGDLGFHGESVYEEEIESDGEDLMVGFLGSEVFFDGICGGVDEGQGVEEEEFREFERRIDETLEIKEEESYDFYSGNGDDQLNCTNSDEIVSCGRDLVQSLPLPDLISQQELIVMNHQSIIDHPTEGSMYDGIGCSRSYLKRKHDRKDLIPKECSSPCKKRKDFGDSSMRSSVYRQFEDFLIRSVKYSPADILVSQLQMLARNPKEDHCSLSSLVGFFSDFRKKNFQKQTDENPYSMESSLKYSEDDIKDSYSTDMVIQTRSSDIPHGTEPTWDSHGLNSSPLMLNTKDHKKSFDHIHGPVAANSGCKNFPAELIMTFDDVQAIPSESKLNNIFRRFGTLRETETVIHPDSCCARVVFRRRSDAEVAYSSAMIFNFMRSVLKYELSFTPLLSYKANPTLEMEDPSVVMVETQFPKSEVKNEFEFSLEDQSMLQMQLQDSEEEHVADIALESEDHQGYDDADIMT